MPQDKDDYGRLRNEEFLYSTVGNAPAPVVEKPPTPIEKVLLGSGMDPKEVRETSTAIVTLMGRMMNDPAAEQEQMVENFMGRFAQKAAAATIAGLAREAVERSGATSDHAVYHKTPPFAQAAQVTHAHAPAAPTPAAPKKA